MHWLDALVVLGYIAMIFLLAWGAGRTSKGQQLTAESQYLAGRSLTFIESICSIIATEVSALTFLGIPAFAFRGDFSFLQIYIGAILGRLTVALVFLPRIYGKGLTLYEVMDRQENGTGRFAVAAFYSCSKVLSIGVRLFSGSILVGTFLGMDMYVGLFITTFVTFLYTLIGGLKAVVRTDILQMMLFILGGIVAHFLIPEVAQQSWGEMMALAHDAGKTSIFNFDQPWTIVAGLMGGVLFDMSTHGVDQDFAQRLMANHSIKHGQQAIFFSSFISITVGAIFLGIGALLWSFYQTHPMPAEVPNPDHLFAHFIVTYFPVGVKGLMVAGVLAATMSTLDSTINALCATIYNDILPKRSKLSLQTYFLIDNAVITVLLFSVAVVASTNDGLLLLGLKIQSWTAGALLAVFLSRTIFPKYFSYPFTKSSVAGAYAVGIGGVALNTMVLRQDWNWNTYFGCGMALMFLYLVSTLRQARVS